MRIFTSSQKSPLQFSVCGNLISNENFLHIRRTIDEHVLILVQKGTLYINSNNKSYSLKENQFILLRAGEEHFGFKESEGELSYFWMHFKTENNFDEIDFAEGIDFPTASFIFPESGTLTAGGKLNLLFRQLMDFSLENNFYNKEVLNYFTSVIMMELSNQFLNQNKIEEEMNPLVYEICSWIKQNYHRQFTLNDLSEIQNYQPEYLSNLFKKNMKVTVMQYANQIRIETAKKLLPNFSIKETAWSCGFEDEKYFMKVFKKSEGITPTEFKNAFFKKNINSL